MIKKIKGIPLSIFSFLVILSENYGTIILLCCAFILLDLASGLTKAKIQGKVNSSIGYKGFWRKISLLLTLVFGVCLNLFMDYLSTLGIFPVSFSIPISLTIGIYISVNESISICENLSASGVKMPKFVLSALRNTEKKITNQSGKTRKADDTKNEPSQQ